MFQLRAFGSVDLVNPAGQSVGSVVAQPRRTALLLYLACTAPRGFQRRDALLALLWPETDAERGRAALSQALYFLRRSLSEALVVSRGSEEVTVDLAQLRCDVVEFEAALREGREAQALELYRGDFLEGFHADDAPAFSRWVEEQRDRLRALAIDAACKLADAAQREGDLPGALRWTRRAYALAPLEEAPAGRLLRLLGRSGARAEALREYQSFAQRLREELDLEPSAEIRAIADGLRAEDADAALPERHPSDARLGRAAHQRDEAAARVRVAPPAGSLSGAKGRRAAWWMLAGAAAAALAATVALAPDGEHAALREDRVLVASFDNRTGDASLDVLGDMAADWIIQGLQQTELVQVIDPTSALVASRAVAEETGRLAGKERAAALAERSGAGVVVVGAVYRQGDSLHFQTQLVDTRNGTMLRAVEPVSVPADQPIRGVEQLRARVAGSVASTLDRRIASLATAQERAPSFDAYREYILGLELFQRQHYAEALPHFQASARLDTAWVLPLFWAAFTHGNLNEPARRDSIVQTVAGRRERLSPLDQHSLDYFLADSRGDVTGTLEAARKAARLSSGSVWSFLAGRLMIEQNRPREALVHLGQVDPERGWARGWRLYWRALADAHHHLGEYEAELAQVRRARALDPEGIAHLHVEIRALVALGRLAEVQARLDEAATMPPDVVPAGEVYHAVALELRGHGHAEAARQMFERSMEWFRSPAATRWIEFDPSQDQRLRRRQMALARQAEAIYQLGRYREARARFQRLRADYPAGDTQWGWNAHLGLIAARLGDREEAERVLDFLERQHAETRMSTVRRNQARIAALLGERERAVAYLSDAVGSRGSSYYPPGLHLATEYDTLWSYPPFEALARPRG